MACQAQAGWGTVKAPTTLQAAEKTLRRLNIYDPDPLIYQEALGLVRQASLNCYAYDVSARSPCRHLSELLAAGSTHCLGQLQLLHMTPATQPQWQMQAALHALRQRGEAWQNRAAAG